MREDVGVIATNREERAVHDRERRDDEGTDKKQPNPLSYSFPSRKIDKRIPLPFLQRVKTHPVVMVMVKVAAVAVVIIDAIAAVPTARSSTTGLPQIFPSLSHRPRPCCRLCCGRISPLKAGQGSAS